MTKTFIITDGKKEVEVGMKIIEGGILHRGFTLVNPSDADYIKSVSPSDLPSTEEESKVIEPKKTYGANELHKISEDEVKAKKEASKAKPDFGYALTLSNKELDKYAEGFGCKLDGRKSLEDNRVIFAKHIGIDYEPLPQIRESVPEDLKCPHCGSKAKTKASYIKNHGDNCIRAMTP